MCVTVAEFHMSLRLFQRKCSFHALTQVAAVFQSVPSEGQGKQCKKGIEERKK